MGRFPALFRQPRSVNFSRSLTRNTWVGGSVFSCNRGVSRIHREPGRKLDPLRNQLRQFEARVNAKPPSCHNSRTDPFSVYGDRGNQDELEKRLPSLLEAFEKFKALYPEDTIRAAQRLAEHYRCPMHPEVVGHRTNSCGKCGMELDQRVRVLPPNPILKQYYEQTISMSVLAGVAHG